MLHINYIDYYCYMFYASSSYNLQYKKEQEGPEGPGTLT